MKKLRYYMAGVCIMMFTCAYSQNIPIEELGISQEEHQQMITHKSDKKSVEINKKFILSIDKNNLWTPVFYPPKETNADPKCIVKPIIIPMKNYKENGKE